MDDAMDDAKLTALITSDMPPASDPRFVVAVMARIEKRRFARELAMTVGLAACAIGLLAILAPTLEIAWESSFAPYASNMTVFLALMGVTVALPYFIPARD